jgi:hypothetical protein
VFDLKGRVVYANEPLLAAWDTSWEELAGRSLDELMGTPAQAQALRYQMGSVAASKR